jgi:hypothetical protein
VRKKLVTAAAVGAIALSGAAIGGSAFAAQTGTPNGTATSPLDRIKQALSGLVADKTITQDQADKVAGALNQAGIGAHPGGPGGPGGHGFRGGLRADLATAAKALGMSESDLRTELMAGKSLAAIAKEKNVSVDTLVAALVAQEKQELADAVKAGRLTQAQADQITKNLQARVTDRVNSTRPKGGPGGFGRHGFGPGGPGAPGQAPGQAPAPSGSAA